jgi:hypothetical protein
MSFILLSILSSLTSSGVARISRWGHHGEREARAYMGLGQSPQWGPAAKPIFSPRIYTTLYMGSERSRVDTCPPVLLRLRHCSQDHSISMVVAVKIIYLTNQFHPFSDLTLCSKDMKEDVACLVVQSLQDSTL